MVPQETEQSPFSSNTSHNFKYILSWTREPNMLKGKKKTHKKHRDWDITNVRPPKFPWGTVPPALLLYCQ